MVEVDLCQDGNTCKTDYNSVSPLIVTSGKIIRHLHRRIGHYLKKHICTPELSTSSWTQALVSLSLIIFLKWHRGDRSTVPSNSPNPFPLISLNFGSGLRVAIRMPKEESLRRMTNKKKAGVIAAVIKIQIQYFTK